MASDHEKRKMGSAAVIWRLSEKKEDDARQAVSGKVCIIFNLWLLQE